MKEVLFQWDRKSAIVLQVSGKDPVLFSEFINHCVHLKDMLEGFGATDAHVCELAVIGSTYSITLLPLEAD